MAWPDGSDPRSDSAPIARALARIGYLLPASSISVLPSLQPVLLLDDRPAPNLAQTGTTNALTRGQLFNFTVPAGFAWEIITMGMVCVAAATASLGQFQGYLTYANPIPVPISVPSPWGPQLITPPGAPGIGEYLCGFIPPRLTLAPGTVFGFMYNGPTDVTGTAIPTVLVAQRPTV